MRAWRWRGATRGAARAAARGGREAQEDRREQGPPWRGVHKPGQDHQIPHPQRDGRRRCCCSTTSTSPRSRATASPCATTAAAGSRRAAGMTGSPSTASTATSRSTRRDAGLESTGAINFEAGGMQSGTVEKIIPGREPKMRAGDEAKVPRRRRRRSCAARSQRRSTRSLPSRSCRARTASSARERVAGSQVPFVGPVVLFVVASPPPADTRVD